MRERRYLINTHIFIWSLDRDRRLPKECLPLVEDGSLCYVSLVSLWEIAIKKSIGKLRMRDDLVDILRDGDIEILPISIDHVAKYEAPPHHHRDPFDRMLIAQAMSENLQVLTADRNFALYDISIV